MKAISGCFYKNEGGGSLIFIDSSHLPEYSHLPGIRVLSLAPFSKNSFLTYYPFRKWAPNIIELNHLSTSPKSSFPYKKPASVL